MGDFGQGLKLVLLIYGVAVFSAGGAVAALIIWLAS